MSWLAKLFSKETSPTTTFERLVKELLKIGRATYRYDKHSGIWCSYWPLGDERNRRVIEIGKELHRLGGNRLEKMQEAGEWVTRELGGGVARDLSFIWEGIGADYGYEHTWDP